ncbi:MAG: hypothetical protein KG075_17465 [Alphaproteobacteria bacterium]|nr:hypothetical protein [Alphaproteobacteria bacterium]
MTACHDIRNPITIAEDSIIRSLASEGYPPAMIRDELFDRGYARSKDTVRLYMWKQKIHVDPVASHSRRLAIFSKAGKDGGGRPPKTVPLTPEQSNAVFGEAFTAGSDGRQYQDEPRAAWKSRVTQPQPVRNYGCNHMTTGGVAVYG